MSRSGNTLAPPRITGTQISQYFRFRCERKLRWELAAGAPGIPLPETAPGLGLLSAAGRAFERRKLRALEARFGAAALLQGGEGHGVSTVALLAALREPGELRFIVQPRLELADPAAFAARFGLAGEALGFAQAQPDLLRIGRWRDGRVRVGVIDVKLSRERAVHHFAQVAYYTLLLEEVLRAAGLDSVRVDTRWGWLWNRGARAPRRFALGAYRHHVEAFIREQLPAIAAADPAASQWHVSARCTGCGWFSHCLGEAEANDDLARVPGLTPLARSVLHGRGIRSVAQLNQAALRPGTWRGCHALESGEPVLRKRVMALAWGRRVEQDKQTPLLGESERVRIGLTAAWDPVSGTVYALGFRAQAGSARALRQVLLSEAGSAAGEAGLLADFAARLQAVAAPLAAAALEAGPLRRGEKLLHLYLWDRQELELLRGLLHRHLGDGSLQPALAALAQAILPGHGAAGMAASAPAPGTLLVDAVSQLFALPVPYALHLPGVSAALGPRERAVAWQPRPDYVPPLASQPAFERIHNLWRGRGHRTAGEVESPRQVRAELERTLEEKLEALDSVLRGLREHASRAAQPRLRLDGGAAPEADAPAAEPIPHPELEALRTFTELEAAAESLAVRALHALPAAERARRFEAITGLEPVERLGDQAWVFEFAPECRDAKFRAGDFALVLTTDNGEMLREVDARPWLRRRLMVELAAYDLGGERPRVLLVSDYGFARLEREGVLNFGRRLVLDRAEADFNTRRVVATLRALAEPRGEPVRRLLAGSAPWAPAALDAGSGWQATLGRPGVVVLNSEQEAAWRAAFRDTVSIVWGPPGTGKTWLLAWTLLGMAAAARAAGRPLRMLVTAATHRAIANVLVRIGREQRASGLDPALELVKLAGRGSESDPEVADAGGRVVEDAELGAVLAAAAAASRPVLVGATVWSLWKQMRAAAKAAGDAEGVMAPLFDVVVIDEASQMKVPEALIALSSLRPGGRVLLCGDDRQLAPIVHGDYGAANTLFGSAFTHFAAGFGRHTLRESRRMNAPLVAYPRRTFYPGLTTAVAGRRLEVAAAQSGDELDARLVDAFLRPGDAVVLCTYRGWSATARNPFEARLAASLARLARARLLDPESGEPFSDSGFRDRALALLSPHRAQNAAILHELLEGGWPRDTLPVVDTIERMQGNEREMIIVSWAVADREYAEREASFLLDPNRFNVAITRARSRLVVLMSEEVLRALPWDERVATESTVLKGYPGQTWREVRELTLPAPDGSEVSVTVRTR